MRSLTTSADLYAQCEYSLTPAGQCSRESDNRAWAYNEQNRRILLTVLHIVTDDVASQNLCHAFNHSTAIRRRNAMLRGKVFTAKATSRRQIDTIGYSC